MKDSTIIDKEKQILKVLETGDIATTKIAKLVHSSYYDVVEILEKLLKEGKIEKFQLMRFTCWRKK